MHEKAPERRKWKQRENHYHIKKEHEKPTHLILNIPRMALKGTKDRKLRGQHSLEHSTSERAGDMKAEYA